VEREKITFDSPPPDHPPNDVAYKPDQEFVKWLYKENGFTEAEINIIGEVIQAATNYVKRLQYQFAPNDVEMKRAVRAWWNLRKELE